MGYARWWSDPSEHAEACDTISTSWPVRLLFGRATTLAPSGHTEFLQRVALAIVVTSWWFLIREILRARSGRRADDPRSDA